MEPVLDIIGESLNDRLHQLHIVIPAYHNIPTAFFTNFVNLLKPPGFSIDILRGPYVQQNMRLAVKRALESEVAWERFLVVEIDMILPLDALAKHALHTDDIVGSVYFQHSPPFHLNAMVKDDKEVLHQINPETVSIMVENPALYKVHAVGLGCTSIARRVLEEWPKEIPTFITEMTEDRKGWDDNYTMGEISHDIYFCREADKLGYSIYLDSTIKCSHLTEGWTDIAHFESWHSKNKELSASIDGDANASSTISQTAKPTPIILPAGFDVSRAKKKFDKELARVRH